VKTRMKMTRMAVRGTSSNESFQSQCVLALSLLHYNAPLCLFFFVCQLHYNANKTNHLVVVFLAMQTLQWMCRHYNVSGQVSQAAL
jgi:hypothetical protein